jgi:hypothetical protein
MFFLSHFFFPSHEPKKIFFFFFRLLYLRFQTSKNKFKTQYLLEISGLKYKKKFYYIQKNNLKVFLHIYFFSKISFRGFLVKTVLVKNKTFLAIL